MNTTKPKPLSVYWLTFARIVLGQIPLNASSLREILFRPVPPFSYKPLIKMFNEHLSIGSRDTSFLNRFTMGPNKQPLSNDRVIELGEMYLYLLENNEYSFVRSNTKYFRYEKQFFYVPLTYDALYLIKKSESYVKYLLAYKDPKYIASCEELDVLLAMSAMEIPRIISGKKNMMLGDQAGLFKISSQKEKTGNDYWALRFSAVNFGYSATIPEFYTIESDKILGLFERAQETAKKLDKLLGLIRESNDDIDERMNTA